MAERKQFEFFLLRYVPNVVSGEFVNFGLLMKEARADDEPFYGARFTRDWQRLKCIDPQVDLELLQMFRQEIERRFVAAADRQKLLDWLADTHSNLIELTAGKRVLSDNPALELEELAHDYLEGVPSVDTKEKELKGRTLLVKKMTDEFDRRAVLPLLMRDIKLVPDAGAGLTFDFGYALGNDLKLFQALSLKHRVVPAIKLLKRYPAVRENAFKSDKKNLFLTTVVEDDLDRADETISFLIGEMNKQEIEVSRIGQMAVIAEDAGRALKV